MRRRKTKPLWMKIADYWGLHKDRWCYKGEMAKEFIGFNSTSARKAIENSLPLARTYREKKYRDLIIPLFKTNNGRNIVAYKIATEDDKKCIFDELLKRKTIGVTCFEKFKRGIGASVKLLPEETKLLELMYQQL